MSLRGGSESHGGATGAAVAVAGDTVGRTPALVSGSSHPPWRQPDRRLARGSDCSPARRGPTRATRRTAARAVLRPLAGAGGTAAAARASRGPRRRLGGGCQGQGAHAGCAVEAPCARSVAKG